MKTAPNQSKKTCSDGYRITSFRYKRSLDTFTVRSMPKETFLQYPQNSKQIDMTVDGLKTLKDIFSNCTKKAELLKQKPSFSDFICDVEDDEILKNILDYRYEPISNEIYKIRKLNYLHQPVSWNLLVILLKENTNINFPKDDIFSFQDDSSFQDYQNLLYEKNILEKETTDNISINQYTNDTEQEETEFYNLHNKYRSENDDITCKIILLLKTGQLIDMRLKPLNQNDHDLVEKTLRSESYNKSYVIIQKFDVEVTKEKIDCLQSTIWLNDEVINFYMSMLQERDEELKQKYSHRKPSFFMNSFFIERLLNTDKKYKYENVAKWTKKIDVFDHDKIFFPINSNNTHWTLAVVYIQKNEIHTYDSMGREGKVYAEGLLNWIVDERRAKKNISINKNEWSLIYHGMTIPQQKNGNDCGVFSIICADFLSDNLPLQYSQSNISNFRNKIAADIIRGKLNYSSFPEPPYIV